MQRTPAGGILLVEDEPSLARLMATLLSRAGYRVEVCATGSDALRLMGQNGAVWDAAILDVSLPDLRGEELATQFHRRHPAARIILTSGLPLDNRIALPPCDFLQKPFQPKALLDVLERR